MAGLSADRPSEVVLAARVARQFYLEGVSKVDIADQLGISRFRVARLLDSAREAGMVRIEIGLPGGNLDAGLSAELCSAFGLKHAFVFNFPDEDEEALRHRLGEAAGQALMDLIAPGDVLGMSWSRTLSGLTASLTQLPPCPIVQLTGAVPPPDGRDCGPISLIDCTTSRPPPPEGGHRRVRPLWGGRGITLWICRAVIPTPGGTTTSTISNVRSIMLSRRKDVKGPPPKPLLLGDDLDGEGNLDLAVEADGHLVGAQRLDGLHRQLPPVELDPQGPGKGTQARFPDFCARLQNVQAIGPGQLERPRRGHDGLLGPGGRPALGARRARPAVRGGPVPGDDGTA